MKTLLRLLCVLVALTWPSLALAQNGVPYSTNVQMPTFVIPASAGGPNLTTSGTDVTVTTCGTGTVTAKSKNSAGEITATGATACTVVFATPTFVNAPYCVAVAESGTQPTVTVSTTVSVTVTGLTSGAKFFYLCIGAI